MPTMIESNLQDDTLYFQVNTSRLDAATAREFKTECSEHWNPGSSVLPSIWRWWIFWTVRGSARCLAFISG